MTKVIVERAVEPATGGFGGETEDGVEVALLVLRLELAPLDSLGRVLAMLGISWGKNSC
jgi:hypothetical protein